MMEPRLDDPGQWFLLLLSVLMMIFCITAP